MVTERLSTDLLTVILQSESGKLSERLTKFISYQVYIKIVR